MSRKLFQLPCVLWINFDSGVFYSFTVICFFKADQLRSLDPTTNWWRSTMSHDLSIARDSELARDELIINICAEDSKSCFINTQVPHSLDITFKNLNF